MPDRRANRILGPGSWSEATRIAEILRKETVGGALLLLGSVVALVWVNSPASDSYTALRDYTVGPEALHLHLSLGTWSADGLLAIFFFVVGLELKREFVAGDLRDPARAALPILAALGGVAFPAGIYVLVNLSQERHNSAVLLTSTQIAPIRVVANKVSSSAGCFCTPVRHPVTLTHPLWRLARQRVPPPCLRIAQMSELRPRTPPLRDRD